MPSFDVVCTVDGHEITNAVDQAKREIGTRFDFRGSKSSIALEEKTLTFLTEDDMKLRAMQEILRQKMAKRGISLKLLEFKDSESAGGDMIRQQVLVKDGLTTEELKTLAKVIKTAKMKVQAQIQEDKLRVTGKKRDDLQEAIALLKRESPELELQFVNFRD
ncbi:MAG: YajQ family cyclic di-GMP-binding protein [Bdellovibrionales bacterium]|nr:YajQ family cyclic di-GMP-binding protein [Bdellovibrionales bacterium]